MPVETGAGVQRTVEQVIDVLDDAEEQAQQRTVEQIVSVATETTEAATTTPLDKAELDVTQHVTQRVQAKAAPKFECSLRRGIRLELERVRYQEQAKRRFKRARERSAERQRASSAEWVPLWKKRLQRAVTYAASAPVDAVHYSCLRRIRSNRTSGRVCDRDGVRSARDALYSYRNPPQLRIGVRSPFFFFSFFQFFIFSFYFYFFIFFFFFIFCIFSKFFLFFHFFIFSFFHFSILFF